MVMSFIQLNLFDEIKACNEPKTDKDILDYLIEKFPQYKPNFSKWKYPSIFIGKVYIYLDYREASKYSSEELRNGYYSVGLDGGTFGETMPTPNFNEAVEYFGKLIEKALDYGKKEIN